MSRWIRLAARLYPRSWRGRYGAEFDAMLDQTAPRARDFFNVLGGALWMQLMGPGPRVALLGAAIGAAIAVVLSFAAPRQYEAHAAVRIEGAAPDSSERLAELVRSATVNVFGVWSDLNLYPVGRRKGADGLRVAYENISRREQVRQAIRLTPTTSPAGFDIAFTYPDEVLARKAVQLISARLAERSEREISWHSEMRERLRRSIPNSEIPVLESAKFVPIDGVIARPLGRNWLIYAAAGVAAGLLAAFIWRKPRMALRIAVFAAAGAALGVGVFLALPTRYTASAYVRIAPPITPLVPYDVAARTAEFRQIEKQILVDHNLALPPLQAVNTPPNIWSGNLRVQLIHNPLGFTITYTCDDRTVAWQAVEQVESAFMTAHLARSRQVDGPSQAATYVERNMLGVRYEAVQGPNLLKSPNSSQRLLLSLAGLAMGLVAGTVSCKRHAHSPR